METFRLYADHPGPLVALWISVRDGIRTAGDLNRVGEEIGLGGLGSFGIEALKMSGIIQGSEEDFEIVPQIEADVRAWLAANRSTIEEYVAEYRALRERGGPFDEESALEAQQRIVDIGLRLRFGSDGI